MTAFPASYRLNGDDMRKRVVLLAAALAVGVPTLAACGSSGGSNSDNRAGSYTLGFTGALSGDLAQLGINEANAVKLAISQANAKGDLGFTMKYSESDDAGDAGKGSTAAQKLIQDTSVVAVIGPTFFDPAKTAEPRYSAAGLTSLSPSATGPALTTSGFTAFFRDVPSDNVQGEQAADYIAKVIKAKRVYSINDKSEYAILSGALDLQLKKDRVDVTSEPIAPTKNYATIAGTILQAKPDFVYYSGFYRELALLAKALHAAGYNGPIGSGDGSKDDQLITLAAQDAEGIYLTCPCSDPNLDPTGATFATAYEAMFSAKPGPYSAEAYAAANAIIGVMKSWARTRSAAAACSPVSRA